MWLTSSSCLHARGRIAEKQNAYPRYFLHYRLRTLTSVRWQAVTADPALDDIISAKRSQNPRPSRGRQSSASRGKGAKAAAFGNTAAAVSNANRKQPPVVFPGRGAQGSKVIVSNLPMDVTEAQVKVSDSWEALTARNCFRRRLVRCAAY